MTAWGQRTAALHVLLAGRSVWGKQQRVGLINTSGILTTLTRPTIILQVPRREVSIPLGDPFTFCRLHFPCLSSLVRMSNGHVGNVARVQRFFVRSAVLAMVWLLNLSSRLFVSEGSPEHHWLAPVLPGAVNPRLAPRESVGVRVRPRLAPRRTRSEPRLAPEPPLPEHLNRTQRATGSGCGLSRAGARGFQVPRVSTSTRARARAKPRVKPVSLEESLSRPASKGQRQRQKR